MNAHKIVLYHGKEHEILYVYESQYIEIQETDSVRRIVKLVHCSKVQPLDDQKG